MEIDDENTTDVENETTTTEQTPLESEASNDVTPTTDELSKALESALVENATLKQRLETVTRERDEANALFLNGGRKSEPAEKTYNDILGDIQ